MEAGRSRMDYEIWRALFLPDLKFKATVSRVLGGWPLQRLDEEKVERKLAQQWLDEKAQESCVETSEPRPSQDDPSAASLGPLMTTSEAQALIQEEIEGGRPGDPQGLRERAQARRKDSQGKPGGTALAAGRAAQGLAAGEAWTGIRWTWEGALAAQTTAPHHR